jgi:uncharacterized membrane protein YGL010W
MSPFVVSCLLMKGTMPVRGIYSKWAVRHTHPLSLALHCIGIPLTIAAVPALLLRSFAIAAVLFIAGYVLQFIGHAVEGNKSGEQLLLEKLLRRR